MSAHIKFIPDEEVQVFFHAADVVILPYRAVLTSGSAILAISFGKPVVAPALGLITDLIRDGEDGLLYDPDEPGGLLRAMRRFLDLDARARTRMGAAARATAARLSWGKASGALYLDALAGAVGKPEILGAGENGRRCFIRRGAIAKSDVVLSVVHEDDIEKTSACVASIIGQPEAIVDCLVVFDERESLGVYGAMRRFSFCDDRAGASGNKQRGGTKARAVRRETRGAAIFGNRRIQSRFRIRRSRRDRGFGRSTSGSESVFRRDEVPRYGERQAASHGLAEMNVSRDDGFLHNWLTAIVFESGDT